ncbi:MAG TPA: lysophospholipid acyltransferase family protein [Gemmataceae bacterium]|jgi:1-acyl-sn-glycerol-3-phosphate acyltransferase|nr:lysophospholipid acyltransferase family protein [Gemmataceae bacterium]
MYERLTELIYVILRWIFGMAAILCFGFRILRQRRLPEHGPVLVLANHQSYLDILLIGLACNRRLIFVARVGLARNPVLAWIMRQFDTVLIDNEGLGKSGLQAVERMLCEGRATLIFPEGERTRDGKMQELKPGVTLLIRRVPNLTVVPAAAAGAFEAWPRFRKLPRLMPPFLNRGNRRIAVCVGAGLPASHLTEIPRREMLELLHAEIGKCLVEAESLR